MSVVTLAHSAIEKIIAPTYTARPRTEGLNCALEMAPGQKAVSVLLFVVMSTHFQQSISFQQIFSLSKQSRNSK
jgi:hypothetical protein